MSGEGIIRNQPLIHAPLQFRLRSGGAQAKDKAFITCPVCRAPMYIRDSDRITDNVKHLHTQCTNVGCAMSGMHQLAFVHYYSPGLLMAPEFNLKQCPREQIPHILPPQEGADDGQMTMFSPPD